LYENDIGDSGAQALAEALKINKCLTALDLRCNRIECTGAMALAAALPVNVHLRQIDFCYNLIRDDGARRLIDGLKQNATIEQMEMFGNPLSGETYGLLETVIHDRLLRAADMNQTYEAHCVFVLGLRRLERYDGVPVLDPLLVDEMLRETGQPAYRYVARRVELQRKAEFEAAEVQAKRNTQG